MRQSSTLGIFSLRAVSAGHACFEHAPRVSKSRWTTALGHGRDVAAEPRTGAQVENGMRIKTGFVYGVCCDGGFTKATQTRRDSAAGRVCGSRVDRPRRDTDEEFELHGVKIVCDPKSYLYLNGTSIDFKDEVMGRGFVFNNPNANSTCGCGSSFSA